MKFSDAYDEVINEDGTTSVQQVWPTDNRKIFAFDTGINIENESSNFNQHRLAVIRQKIETNLAIAITNYNTYSGATNEFQMPELKEDEWDYIIDNISLISFLQGLPIGGKTYNGYTIVTNSESKEVVLEENIYILGNDNTYHRIGDNTIAINNSGETPSVSTQGAKINLDFKRQQLLSGTMSIYYYPLKDYNASYDSIVTQNNVTTYDDIYTYIDKQKELGNTTLADAFYTALGRERKAMYRASNISNSAYGTIFD